MLGFHPARLGPCLEHSQAGAVVDEDLRLRESAGGGGEPVPVGGRQEPGAHGLGIHLGLGTEHALHELLSGHLETEHERRPAQVHADVLHDVEREGRVVRDDVVVGDVERGGMRHRDALRLGHARGLDGHEHRPARAARRQRANELRRDGQELFRLGMVDDAHEGRARRAPPDRAPTAERSCQRRHRAGQAPAGQGQPQHAPRLHHSGGVEQAAEQVHPRGPPRIHIDVGHEARRAVDVPEP